jgi:putative membrane protein
VARRRLSLAVGLGAFLGLALAVGLIAWFGAATVLKSLAVIGWSGLVLLVLAHLALMALCGIAWRAVVLPGDRVSALRTTAARLLRDAGSELLPFSPAGGAVMGARGLMLAQTPMAMAFASSVVDMTTELFGQLIFTGLGVAVLLYGGWAPAIGLTALAGLALGVVATAGFVVAQRMGMFRMFERVTRRILARDAKLRPPGSGVHDAIHAIYGRPIGVAAGFLWHLVSWLLTIAETWLALYLLRIPLPIPAIVVIESLIYALRSVAFFVPSGWGVQEGGYVLLGTLVGLGPDAALALSLAKRARELAIGLPVLLLWQAFEARLFRGPSASA